jgi:hypothetical protein
MTFEKKLDARLVIGNPGGPRSGVWRVWSSGDEVYVVTANSGGIEKISFDRSRQCRKEFTQEHGSPDGMADRATVKWTRDETPPPGSGKAMCVLELAVPTDFLSACLETPRTAVSWIAPAPAEMATVLEMFFTRDPGTIRSLMGDERIISHTVLSSGESFAVARHNATFPGEEFYIPDSHHQGEDYIFLKDDPLKTGRPARFTAFNDPKDGGRMTVLEYGGYRGVVTAELAGRGVGTFNRKEVFDRRSNN